MSEFAEALLKSAVSYEPLADEAAAENFCHLKFQEAQTVLTYQIFCDFLDWLRHRKGL